MRRRVEVFKTMVERDLERGVSGRMVPLGEVTRWLSGGTPNRSVSKYWEGEIPWISASTLKTSEISESDQHLSPEGVIAGSKMAPVGSTLFLVRGSALYNEIRAGLVVKPVCFNQDVKALIPNPNIFPKFLTYSLLGRNEDLLKLVSTASNSTGVLDTKLVQAFEILLPPLSEQRAIAAALSDADGLIRALDALIEKKRAIKQAAMQQLLTGKKRLPGFEGEWEVKRLGEVGSFAKGRGIKRDDVTDEGSPCIRYGELYTRYHNYITTPVSRIPPAVAQTALLIQTGDLLFAGSGETAEDIGRCVAYLGDEQAYAGGDIVVLTPSGQNSIYLGYLMNHPLVTAQKARLSQGDVIVHISATNLAQVEINLPPIDEQRAIAAVLSDMDTEIAALERRRDKAEQVKQGMMQELLTGRTRLIDPLEAPA